MKVGESGNAESQKMGIAMADGLWNDAHARDDIQRKIQERMPSKFARGIYNDSCGTALLGHT